MEVERAEAEVEVFAEALRLHLGGEVAVGGGDHAHIHGAHAGAAHALDATALQHDQQAALGFEGQLPDLVEEDGAAVGLLEVARVRGDGAGKGPALMAEELAVDGAVGQRAAVDLHPRLA